MIHEFEARSCMTFRYLGHEEYILTKVRVPKTHQAVNLVRLKTGRRASDLPGLVDGLARRMSHFHSIRLCLRSTLTTIDKPYNQATRAIYILL